jgi:hypothetical protein
MQKKLLLLFVPLCFCAMILGGCKKSSPITNTTLITKDKWKFSAAAVAGVGDVTNQIPVCYRDNITTFFSDGSGTIDEGGNVCSPPTTGIFSWSFQSNETILSMTNNLIPGGTGTFNIVTLNETTLELSQETSLIPSPTPLVISITFVHP